MKPRWFHPLPGTGFAGRTIPLISVWLRDLVISLAISAFIIIFLYQPVKVEGTSMMPSLDDQERIFVNKFVYRLEPIERGDMVVFRYPRDPSKSFIKRVIGVAGDHIRIDDGQVYRERQAARGRLRPASIMRTSGRYPETVVPQHSYFVLGDHRTMSNDSRDFGPVNSKLHLRQSRVWILADGEDGKSALDCCSSLNFLLQICSRSFSRTRYPC